MPVRGISPLSPELSVHVLDQSLIRQSIIPHTVKSENVMCDEANNSSIIDKMDFTQKVFRRASFNISRFEHYTSYYV